MTLTIPDPIKNCLAALLDCSLFGETDPDSPEKKIAELYKTYQSNLMAFWGMSDAATATYYSAIRRAIEQKGPIHLSRKLEGLPFSAEIGAQGQLILNTPKSQKSDLNSKKKIKLGYDVLNQQQVVRSVEIEGRKTQRHRANEEAAMEDFKGADWMLKEVLYLTYKRRDQIKHVTIRESMDMDLFMAISKGLSVSTKISFIRQFLKQLCQIHEKGIHRDLKTENVLVNLKTGILKIFDFEYYTRHADLEERKKSPSGTALSTPPEAAKKWIARADDYTDIHTPAYDMWAAGLLILEIWYDRHLLSPWDHFPSKTPEQIQNLFGRISRTTGSWVPYQQSEKPLDVLICNLLQIDPAKRWTAKQALEHLNFLQITFSDR